MSKLRSIVARGSRALVNPRASNEGERVYNKLNGLFSIYKPPDMDLATEGLRLLKHKLVYGINLLPCRPIEQMVKIDDESNEPRIEPNMADAVEGLKYAPQFKDATLNISPT